MSVEKPDPSKEELYRSGKLERRRSARPLSIPPQAVAQDTEEETKGFKLRPEVVALALMVILLLIIAAVAI